LDNRGVQVPVSLLLDPDQTATTKVIWMTQRRHPDDGPAQLRAHTGLSPNTIRHGLAKVPAFSRTRGGALVTVPGALLADRSVGAQTKVLYGLLQATPDFRGASGRFSYASLRALTHLSRSTLKQAIADLTGAGWVRVTQENRLKPITFTLGTPELIRSQAEAAAAERRLIRAK